MPFLIKDLGQEYVGLPTSRGSRALADDVATEHALVTQRFLDAGLVAFGKTNTPELGRQGRHRAGAAGVRPATPGGLDHTPGGSSGGSGRRGRRGHRARGRGERRRRVDPDPGGLQRPGGPEGQPRADAVRAADRRERCSGWSPRAWSPGRCGTAPGLLDAIVGRRPGCRLRGRAADDVRSRSCSSTTARRLRIGFTRRLGDQPHPDPEAVAAVEGAAALLAELGHEVEEVAPPHDDEALTRDFLTIWFGQLHGQVEEIKRRTGAKDADFEADTLLTAELGRSAGLGAFLAALDRVHAHTRALAAFHRTHDLLLTPTLARPPLPVESTRPPTGSSACARVVARCRSGRALAAAGVVDQLIEDAIAWVPYTQLANLTGRPAISVPLHWTPAGLPLGVQLVGPLGGDGLLLQVAAQLERARPWAHRYADLDPALPR